MKIKEYLILTLVFILVVFGIIVSIRCSKLEKENIELQTSYNTIIDSIRMENQLLTEKTQRLSESLDYYKFKVDSLEKIKQKVLIQKEYVVSEDLISGVKLLKENIKCEKR